MPSTHHNTSYHILSLWWKKCNGLALFTFAGYTQIHCLHSLPNVSTSVDTSRHHCCRYHPRHSFSPILILRYTVFTFLGKVSLQWHTFQMSKQFCFYLIWVKKSSNEFTQFSEQMFVTHKQISHILLIRCLSTVNFTQFKTDS